MGHNQFGKSVAHVLRRFLNDFDPIYLKFQNAYNFTFTKFHEIRLIIDGVINEKHALLCSSVLMYSVGWS